MPIHHYTCKGSNDQQRRDEEYLHQAQCGGTACFLKNPDREGERAHVGGKDRNNLSEPNDREA
jgi:hypothetical protein